MSTTKAPPTEAELQAASARGHAAAIAMLDTSSAPIWIKDELCATEESSAEAMGWNSVWASDENKVRWAATTAPRVNTVKDLIYIDGKEDSAMVTEMQMMFRRGELYAAECKRLRRKFIPLQVMRSIYAAAGLPVGRATSPHFNVLDFIRSA